MEMYRSGHNGAHSKCVSPPGLMGSNPIISAIVQNNSPEALLRDYYFVLLLKLQGDSLTPVTLGRGQCARRRAPPQLAEQPVKAHTRDIGSEEYKMTTQSNYLNSHF